METQEIINASTNTGNCAPDDTSAVIIDTSRTARQRGHLSVASWITKHFEPHLACEIKAWPEPRFGLASESGAVWRRASVPGQPRVIGIAGTPFSEKLAFAIVICDRLANAQQIAVPVIQADWDTTKTRHAVNTIKSTGKGKTMRGDEVRVNFVVVVGSNIFLDDELLAMIDLCVYIDSSAKIQFQDMTDEAITRENAIAERADMILDDGGLLASRMHRGHVENSRPLNDDTSNASGGLGLSMHRGHVENSRPLDDGDLSPVNNERPPIWDHPAWTHPGVDDIIKTALNDAK